MAIDTMLYMADVPAGTYAAGDEITLTLKSGPTVVRDGLGQPILKDICTGALFNNRSASKVAVKFYVQNQNWNDPIINGNSALDNINSFSEDARGLQVGNDCPLMVNSAFTVKAVFEQAVTTTVDNSLFATIDIEYPNVGAVVNPAGEIGTPASLEYEFENYTAPLVGTSASATWVAISVDAFKAGYRYLMQKISAYSEGIGIYAGFIAISGGASMGGLRRIIPVTTFSGAISKKMKYATVEVKGPVTYEAMVFLDSTAPVTADMVFIADYVKRM